MSVRRLAEASVQPASFAFNKANTAWARQTIKKYPKGREQSAVIPLLMRAQEQDGWVTKSAIEHVADMLDMPYIRVLEVATFYTQFQLKPVGTKAHIQVCGTTPCMLRGSEALMDVCRSKIHHDQFHTNDNGTLSWEEVECQGACVNAPMVIIFKDAYEDLTPERLAEVIDEFEAGRGDSVPTGPQNGRTFSAPESGLTALTDEKAVLKTTRDKETKAAARAAKAPAAPEVAPTQAGKPKTDAIETSPAIKSPSKVKADPAVEKAASASAPQGDKQAADKVDPFVEKTDEPRVHPDKHAAPAKAFQAPETEKATAAEVAEKPSLDDANRPAGVEKPDQPDDLKLISGVGPKLEGVLNGLGIYSYAQVASWNQAERDWVDRYLKFRGRIDRDDWVRQAEALAKGGEAEYIRVFGKKPR
ncbi:NADH-quinone oxidoreductase subunit E [Mesorhizobium sp. CAU 1741]|uniref:NADH-quinone oxidoreductase subunit E n=1 Tax=Mesorhizobium sp. CAU 1741 TaxID=3140366 RepID=UPI00325B0AC0